MLLLDKLVGMKKLLIMVFLDFSIFIYLEVEPLT